MEVRVPNPDVAALVAARFVANRIRTAVAGNGRVSIALSGGTTPWAMLDCLTSSQDRTVEVADWSVVDVFQVDERVAPDGDERRNLTKIERYLGDTEAHITAMPVTASNLTGAAAEYSALLPASFDLTLLGMGGDGHTASLIPGDPVLGVDDSDVGVTGEYQGTRRMTLTYSRIRRSRELIWLVTGDGKDNAMKAWRSNDERIPAARVGHTNQTMITDIW